MTRLALRSPPRIRLKYSVLITAFGRKFGVVSTHRKTCATRQKRKIEKRKFVEHEKGEVESETCSNVRENDFEHKGSEEYIVPQNENNTATIDSYIYVQSSLIFQRDLPNINFHWVSSVSLFTCSVASTNLAITSARAKGHICSNG